MSTATKSQDKRYDDLRVVQDNPIVRVFDNDIEAALKQFKRRCKRAGLFDDDQRRWRRRP